MYESPLYTYSWPVIAMLSCLLHGSDSPRSDLGLTLHIKKSPGVSGFVPSGYQLHQHVATRMADASWVLSRKIGHDSTLGQLPILQEGPRLLLLERKVFHIELGVHLTRLLSFPIRPRRDHEATPNRSVSLWPTDHVAARTASCLCSKEVGIQSDSETSSCVIPAE